DRDRRQAPDSRAGLRPVALARSGRGAQAGGRRVRARQHEARLERRARSPAAARARDEPLGAVDRRGPARPGLPHREPLGGLAGVARFLEERMGMSTRVLEVTREGDGAEELAQAGPAVFAQAAALALRGASTERVTQTDFRQAELAYAPDLTGLRPQLQLTV